MDNKSAFFARRRPSPFYPAMNSALLRQRLMAEGDVRLAQGDQEARCDRLDYDRLNERLVCRGNPGDLAQGDIRTLSRTQRHGARDAR